MTTHMGNHIFNFSKELSQRMGLTLKVQLPYTDSLKKKKLQMEANLQLIHFSFNQTPNMFYETKEFFKCSKGHFPNGEEHGHPILGLLPVRICILLPSQGNAEKLIFLDALFLLHPHSQGYLAHWDIPGHPSETSKTVTKGFKLWPKRAMRTLDV